MESIRNFLKSWPGRIFLMVCLSPLVILGLESYFSGSSNPDELIHVGDESITRSEYQETIKNRRNELVQQGIDPSFIDSNALSDDVLKNMINRALLANQAKKLGVTVSDNYIKDMLLTDPQFKNAEGNFSDERFETILRQRRLTTDQLFNQYRQQLSLSHLYDGVAQTALYSANGIDQLIDWQQETRNVWLHRLPWQDFVAQTRITDDEIQNYYDTHKNDLNSVAMVDLSYVRLNPQSVNIEPVTEDDIKAEYEAFKTNYVGNYAQKVSQILIAGDDALSKIQTIERQIKDGKSFEALAQEMSQDTSSRDNGGDIGTFNPEAFGDDGKKVAQAIEDLAVGEVSQPVETNFGMHLFKVTDIQGDAIPSYDEMHDKLKESAEQQRRAAIIDEKVTRINEMVIDGLSVADIAEQEGLKLDKIADFTQLNNQTALNQPAIIEAVFDSFRLQDESVSTSINIGNDTLWVQPFNYRPIKPLTAEQASEQIKEVLTQQKAIALAESKAKDMAKEINDSGAGIQAVNVAFTPLGEVTRQSTGLLPAESAAIFSKETASEGKVDTTSIVGKTEAMAQATSQGATVMVVSTSKKSVPEPVSESQRTQITRDVLQRRGQEDASDYLDYLKMVTDIKENASMMADITGS